MARNSAVGATLALALSIAALSVGCSSSDFQVAAPSGDDAGDLDGQIGGDTSGVDTGARGDSTGGDGVVTDVPIKPDSPTPDGPLPPIDAPGGAEASCAALADAFCARFDHCFPALFSVLLANGAECRARRKADCLVSVGAPGAHETDTTRSGCAAGWTAMTCDEFATGESPTACVPPPGDVPNGGACALDAQCATGVCDLAANAPCGTCVPGGAGSPCLTRCLPTLKCAPDGHCRAPVPTGGACEPSSAPCGTLDGCVNGVCEPLGTSVGVDCNGGNVDVPSCSVVHGLYCPKPIAGGKTKCQAYDVVDVGAHCGPIFGAPFALCREGTCKPNGDGTFSCVSEIDDGLACDPASYSLCKTFAKCVGGTCSLPAPTTCK